MLSRRLGRVRFHKRADNVHAFGAIRLYMRSSPSHATVSLIRNSISPSSVSPTRKAIERSPGRGNQQAVFTRTAGNGVVIRGRGLSLDAARNPYFLSMAGILWFLLTLTTCVTIFSWGELAVPDSLYPMCSVRCILLFFCLVETLVLAVLVFGRSTEPKAIAVLWVSSIWLLYTIGVAVGHLGKECAVVEKEKSVLSQLGVESYGQIGIVLVCSACIIGSNLLLGKDRTFKSKLRVTRSNSKDAAGFHQRVYVP